MLTASLFCSTNQRSAIGIGVVRHVVKRSAGYAASRGNSSLGPQGTITMSPTTSALLSVWELGPKAVGLVGPSVKKNTHIYNLCKHTNRKV